MPPPPAESIASRVFLGPALRTQPDRRLVTLVREGYEAAFEEIVRRYGKPLGRYAAAIVGARAEDVTQDAFSKALPALRRGDQEIELRPWLYRIVRNTALNDIRDRPPTAEALDEALEGGPTAAEAAERREEMTELMSRLRALPESQRAAIVMRELEGLSHEEIAAALGVSGGAARQAIHRARVSLRDGLGMLVPLPLLRLLIDHGGEAAAAGAATATAGGAVGGGLGTGAAIKAGVVTVVLAGSVGTGIAVREHRDPGSPDATAASATGTATAAAAPQPPIPTAALGRSSETTDDRGGHRGPGRSGGDDPPRGDGHSGVASGQSFEQDEGHDGHKGRREHGSHGHRHHQTEPEAEEPKGRGHGRGGSEGPRPEHGGSGGRGIETGGSGKSGPKAGKPDRHGPGGGNHGSEEVAPPPPPPTDDSRGGGEESGSGSAGSGRSKDGEELP